MAYCTITQKEHSYLNSPHSNENPITPLKQQQINKKITIDKDILFIRSGYKQNRPFYFCFSLQNHNKMTFIKREEFASKLK